MAKVLFVNPVIREEDDPRHVPYGMALLAAIIMREGHLVQVFDANAWRASDAVLSQVLAADRWDVVGLGGITTAYRSIKQIVRRAKDIAPQALVVAGGGFLTSMPHDIMRFLPQVDACVVGEAFASFPELLRRLDAGNRDWAKVPGLVWRGPDGVSHLNPEQPLLQDIDRLPYPAWELFPLDVYFKNSMALYSEEGMGARRRLDINASYGCSLICRFCFHLGIDGVPHDPERCTGVHWGGTSHATLCSPEVLKAIKRAGCSHLVYGYETFSARVMKTIGKGATPEANERSLRWTLEAGIRPIPNQMIGFPDEDFDSLRDNVLAWNRLGLQVKPFFATPYPGTEWYQKYKSRILEQYDGDLEAFLLDVGDATRLTAVISKKFNAVEIYGLRELMVQRDLKRLAEYEAERNRLHPVDPLAEEKAAWTRRFGGAKSGRTARTVLTP